MENKIAFIIIYYGKIPKYLPIFLESAKKNKHLDFVFFTDWEKLPVGGANLFNYHLPLSEFNKIAISKGILHREITYGYKLCDLKPAWLDILEEYFPEDRYEYVGYIDIDMFLGRTDQYITLDKIKNFDIWTITDSWISGAFTLFRNSRKMKHLYKRDKHWNLDFNNPMYSFFDEDTFTEVVRDAEKNGDIKVSRNGYTAFQVRPYLLQYVNGQITNERGDEFICFHYSVAKRYFLWMLPDWQMMPEEFYINKYGFYENKENPFTLFKIMTTPKYLKELIKNIKKGKGRVFNHLRNSNLKTVLNLIKDQF